MKKYFQFLDYVSSLMTKICSVILLLMLVITFAQVVLRYVFNSPLIWASEVTILMLIWFGFIVMSLAVYANEHISLEFLYDKLQEKVQKTLDCIKYFLLGCFALLMIYYGFQLVDLTKYATLPASGLSKSYLYLILIFSGVIILIASISNFIKLFTQPGS